MIAPQPTVSPPPLPLASPTEADRMEALAQACAGCAQACGVLATGRGTSSPELGARTALLARECAGLCALAAGSAEQHSPNVALLAGACLRSCAALLAALRREGHPCAECEEACQACIVALERSGLVDAPASQFLRSAVRDARLAGSLRGLQASLMTDPEAIARWEPALTVLDEAVQALSALRA